VVASVFEDERTPFVPRGRRSHIVDQVASDTGAEAERLSDVENLFGNQGAGVGRKHIAPGPVWDVTSGSNDRHRPRRGELNLSVPERGGHSHGRELRCDAKGVIAMRPWRISCPPNALAQLQSSQ